jgi:NAD(P)-dependent dehydrogenase (short-subunit alcohol dehydrogenase family)
MGCALMDGEFWTGSSRSCEKDESQMRILITGAGRAIGAATATELTRAGHEVVATARDMSLLDELDVFRRVRLDVTDDRSVREALEEAGDLDAIVNNAAIQQKSPLESFTVEGLTQMLETNTIGAFRVIKGVLPAWRERGSGVIVNISSVQGRVATPLEGPYAASKYALEALSETLHYEVGHFGIRVVIVEPGYISPGMKPAPALERNGPYEELFDQWERAETTVTGPGGRSAPALVAGAIRSAIEDPKTPLRVPVGNDAVLVLDVRANSDDATFEQAMRDTLGVTW